MSDPSSAKYWMTRESQCSLDIYGGNAKGSAPVHGKPSATANIPLYTADQLRAAVLDERERNSLMLEASANKLAPEGKRTNQVDRHVADVLRRMAVAIRGETV